MQVIGVISIQKERDVYKTRLNNLICNAVVAKFRAGRKWIGFCVFITTYH